MALACAAIPRRAKLTHTFSHFPHWTTAQAKAMLLRDALRLLLHYTAKSGCLLSQIFLLEFTCLKTNKIK